MILDINNINKRAAPTHMKTCPPVDTPPTVTEHAVPDSWKYLKKSTKDAIDQITVEAMQKLLRMGAFPRFINAYDTLTQLYHDGMRMNDDQIMVLLMPIQLWGKKAGYVLYEMRKTLYEEIKYQKERKQSKAP